MIEAHMFSELGTALIAMRSTLHATCQSCPLSKAHGRLCGRTKLTLVVSLITGAHPCHLHPDLANTLTRE